MRTMALELAPHNIRVNAVNPGIVNTKLIHNQPTYDLFDATRDDGTRNGYVVPVLNAASKDAAGGSKSNRRRNSSDSGAPVSRSMPASSHSTEIGPV